MSAVPKLSIFVFFFLLSYLHAAQADSDTAYIEFQKLIASERAVDRRVFDVGENPKVWEDSFDKSPTVIDRYIGSGYHMREIVGHILEHSTDTAIGPKVVANSSLRDYIWLFSWNLAYYDSVLSEEKKRAAAQALISALHARPVDGLGNYIGAQSDPLVALGFYYLFSPWRHRPEVFEYVKTVEFTDHVNFNKDRVNQLVRLHEGAIQEVSLPIPRPGPGKVFPIHPAARARAEAAAQAEREPKHASLSPAAAPAPVPAPPPPTTVSVPAPAAPPAKLSHAVWWLLGVLAALGAVFLIWRRRKNSA